MIEWLDTTAAADYLKVPAKTLVQWRYYRKGPPAAKFGRHVRYNRDQLEAWAKAQTMGWGATRE